MRLRDRWEDKNSSVWPCRSLSFSMSQYPIYSHTHTGTFLQNLPLMSFTYTTSAQITIPPLCHKNTHILIHAHHPIYSCDKNGSFPTFFLYTSTLTPFFSQSNSYTSPSRIFSTDGEVVPSHALGKRSTVEHTHAHSQTAAGGHPQGAVLLAVP